jgi:LPS export ABC transporter protein LptC
MIKPFSISTLLLAALFIIGCLFVSCENDMQVVQELGKKKIGVEEAKDIISYMSQDGKMKAQLTAPFMLRYQVDTPRVEFPKSLRVSFFDSALQVESKLFARKGYYLESENKVFLRDSVVVYNMKGDTLFSKELNWDQQKEIFYTDKNVIIHSPTRKFYGKGLVADQGFKWYTIKSVYNSYMDIPDSTFSDY